MQFVEQRYDNTFLGDLIYDPNPIEKGPHMHWHWFCTLVLRSLNNYLIHYCKTNLSSATFALLKYSVFVIVL